MTSHEQQQTNINQNLDSILRNKDVRVDDVRIVSLNGMDVSIVDHFAMVEIYESLFSNNITGRVSVIDATNLPESLPLTGQEMLLFTFSTPGTEPISKLFIIDKISERVPTKNDKTQIYDLHFISPFFLMNITKKVSKSYKGRISGMVKDIFYSYLAKLDEGNDFGGEAPRIKIEPTFGSHKFVIPNWRPNAAINWLSKRSVSEKYPDRANYIFYEDLDGFKFVSLTTLMRGPVREVYEKVESREEIDTEDDYDTTHRSINGPILVKGFDRSKEIPKGTFSSSMITHDIVTKEWQQTNYNYTQGFDSEKSLNNYPILPVLSDYYARHADSKQYFSPKHSGIHGSVQPIEGSDNLFLEYPDNNRQEMWLMSHDSLINQLKSSKIEFDVLGDSNRRVGDKVQVNVSNMKQQETDLYSALDSNISASYLITRIKHSITLGGHEMRLELSKDSFIKRMPDYIHYETEVAP